MASESRRRRLIRKVAGVYLLAVFFFLWGLGTIQWQLFPHRIIFGTIGFVKNYDLGKPTTVLQKLASDLDLVPARFFADYPASSAENTEPIDVPHLRERRDRPRVFVDPVHARGYRTVFGAFDFEDTIWGGVLLSPTGQVLHTWRLSSDQLSSDVKTRMKWLYALDVLPDGSVVFTMGEFGGGIVRVDACGDEMWTLPGSYHHAITPTDSSTFWTLESGTTTLDPILVEVSTVTGEKLRSIDMSDVREANSHTNIFDLQEKPESFDPTHPNDVEPLPSMLAPLFEGFEPGDLLVSYRNTNLLFVVDPATLKLKWWRVGPWDRQHDPDWESDGRIYVYSNNWRGLRNVTDIVSIDPVTLETDVVVDGESYGSFSRIMGLHQRTPFATRMLSSSTQGWVFEVDDNGKIVFSFLNTYEEGSGKSMVLTATSRYEEDFFSRRFWEECIEEQPE